MSENRQGIRPFIPDRLDSMRAAVDTVRGRVAVAREKRDGDLRLHVTIPANAIATVQVPAPPGARVRCRPSRSPLRHEDGTAVFELGSGRCAICAELKPSGRPLPAKPRGTVEPYEFQTESASPIRVPLRP